MSRSIYSIFQFLLAPFFQYEVAGVERLQNGPAIFIANHLGAVGPLAIVCSLPVRLYIWAIAEMMDYQRAPQYLYDDFVHPTLGLSGEIGLALATAITKISVPLLRHIGCIPVERNAGIPLVAYKRSLEVLKTGGSILIFPEDSQQAHDPETQMAPFMRGFAVLSLMFEQQTEKILPIYPIVVHPETRSLLVGEKTSPHGCQNQREVERFTRQTQEEMMQMYLTFRAV